MSDTALPIDSGQFDATVDEAVGFDNLHRRRFVPMVRLASVLVDTQEEAEEVVQDAFAALLPRFRCIENPDAYLRRSVLNGARQVLRRRQIVRRRPQPRPEHSTPSFNHVLDSPGGGAMKDNVEPDEYAATTAKGDQPESYVGSTAHIHDVQTVPLLLPRHSAPTSGPISTSFHRDSSIRPIPRRT